MCIRDSYTVDTIEYKDDIISALVIKNKAGSVVFTYPKKYTAPKVEVVRDRDAEIKEAETDTLAKAKKVINETLEKQDYTRADSKREFIKRVLEKETIDTIDDAELVMDALENEQ